MSERLITPTTWPSSSTGTFFKWFSPNTRHTSGRSACTSTPMMPFAPMLFAGMPMSSSSLRAKSWLPPSASTVCMIMTTGSISICDRFDR